MATDFELISTLGWAEDDYRTAASLSEYAASIEALAEKVGAKLDQVVDPNHGLRKSFGFRFGNGRQAAFAHYELSKYGPHLILRFDDGICRRSEIVEVLSHFEVKLEHVAWFSPHMKDA